MCVENPRQRCHLSIVVVNFFGWFLQVQIQKQIQIAIYYLMMSRKAVQTYLNHPCLWKTQSHYTDHDLSSSSKAPVCMSGKAPINGFFLWLWKLLRPNHCFKVMFNVPSLLLSLCLYCLFVISLVYELDVCHWNQGWKCCFDHFFAKCFLPPQLKFLKKYGLPRS